MLPVFCNLLQFCTTQKSLISETDTKENCTKLLIQCSECAGVWTLCDSVFEWIFRVVFLCVRSNLCLFSLEMVCVELENNPSLKAPCRLYTSFIVTMISFSLVHFICPSSSSLHLILLTVLCCSFTILPQLSSPLLPCLTPISLLLSLWSWLGDIGTSPQFSLHHYYLVAAVMMAGMEDWAQRETEKVRWSNAPQWLPETALSSSCTLLRVWWGTCELPSVALWFLHCFAAVNLCCLLHTTTWHRNME